MGGGAHSLRRFNRNYDLIPLSRHVVRSESIKFQHDSRHQWTVSELAASDPAHAIHVERDVLTVGADGIGEVEKNPVGLLRSFNQGFDRSTERNFHAQIGPLS